MTTGHINLESLLKRMADRDSARAEANVQSDLHLLLLAAPLSLKDGDLEDQKVVLEQQAGERRRIDVEAGCCVFEVKRDLRKGGVRESAVEQLAGYVEARTDALQQRYVGVLTDGAEWHLFHLIEGALKHVSEFIVDGARPDVEGLSTWIESVLSTATAIVPTPREIEARLGAASAAHALDFAELNALYAKFKDVPSVRLKRELWARLLTTAFGTGFKDRDELFVEHTLLVATAEIIAHAVVGLNPAAPEVSGTAVVTGQLFAASEVHGVVEADFFDWLVEVDGGERFVKTLARRLTRFAWREVEHDVLKVLYESVISSRERKQLGEYYTPDWLADRVVDAAVTQSLKQRVLDPSCGSGTFLFHAIRKYLAAARAKGLSGTAALEGLTKCVVGMDLHPVAVTFARVTYLLAIGPDLLQSEDRPALSIPVYLGDSIQWGQERTLFTSDALVIPTGGASLWARELRFPKSSLADAAEFDHMVSELADLACKPTRPTDDAALKPLLRRYGLDGNDAKTVTGTYKALCDLHDGGRNHIWGYYVRNLARPVWLSRPENRVDVLVGNPPWLSYRFMTKAMQQEFRRLSEERGLWAGVGASVATNQDLSALFVLRCVERYLKPGGRFGFVMPWSVLRGRQFAGFRTGHYSLATDEKGLSLAFGTAWDLHAVKPAFFPVPACVVSGTRAKKPITLSKNVDAWSGKLRRTNVTWPVAKELLERASGTVAEAQDAEPGDRSRYHSRFVQGATIVPRKLLVVEKVDAGPLGAGVGRIAVRSRHSASAKAPWKDLPALTGNVEKQFVRKMHVGETILPYRVLDPQLAITPWDGKRLLDSEAPQLGEYKGLQRWWTKAEALWNEHRSSERLTLKGQLDYRKKLSDQLPTAKNRVVYTASGMYLAAAVVRDSAIIEHSLYWGVCMTVEEARYLVAVLNSDALLQRIRPLQARGEHNPRHFDKYVWQVPTPIFDPDNARHAKLSALAEQAEEIAASVILPPTTRFETLRRMIRQAVSASDVGREIESEVGKLLD